MDMIEALEKAPRDSSGVMKSYRSNTVALRGVSRVMNEAVELHAIGLWSRKDALPDLPHQSGHRPLADLSMGDNVRPPPFQRSR